MFALALHLLAATTWVPDAVAACANDPMDNLATLRGRRAWGQRCMPEVAPLPDYPEAAFVTFAHARAPTDAAAPCAPWAQAPILCSGEGILAGQHLLTPQGFRDVAQLAATSVHEVANWDSREPPGAPLPMSALQATVRRPYFGPVIRLQTEQGSSLEVTAGQLVLLANGTTVRADTLAVGDALLGSDDLQKVARVQQTHRNTFVYQLACVRGDYDHNVLLVNGLFVGASHLLQHALEAPVHAPVCVEVAAD